MTAISKHEETRQKLIEVAGQIFAEVGYEAATVRQITDRAQVNVAAVNYYFGDKSQLYRAVLQSVTGRALHLLESHCTHGSPEVRLRQFVRCVLFLESDDNYAWAHLLMARESMELHDTQPVVVVEMIRPIHNIAEDIVRDVLGSDCVPARVKLASSLVVSLCFSRLPQHRLDQRLYPEISSHEIDIETITESVYRFALAGIHGLSKSDFP